MKLTLALPLCAFIVAAGTLAGTSSHAGNESRSQAFSYENNLVEVIADFSEDSIYWCGAATYALANPQALSGNRIYVWQGPSNSAAQPGRKSVKFGFQPPPGGNANGGFSNTVSLVGNSMTVVQAKQTCNERTSSG